MDDSEKMYIKEIALMMHGFGDNSEPLADTVRLVEAITLQQIRNIVRDALQLAESRGSYTIEIRDIVFLLRYNANSIRRLHRFVKYKYLKKCAKIQVDEIDEDILEITNMSGNSKSSKEIETVLQAIAAIDETGELSDLNTFDPIKYARQLRADRISASLDETKYMEYYKARCTSFLNREFSFLKNMEYFKRWLIPKDEKVKFTQLVTEILAYLAFESVAFIVDLTLLVRNDINKKAYDPLGGLNAGNYCNPVSFNSSQVYERFRENGKGHEGQLALTPNEVREAMRRFEISQIGINLGKEKVKRRYLVC